MSLVTQQQSLPIAVQGMRTCFALDENDTALLTKAMTAFDSCKENLNELMTQCASTISFYAEVGKKVQHLQAARTSADQSAQQALSELTQYQAEHKDVLQEGEQSDREYEAAHRERAEQIKAASNQCARNETISFLGMQNPLSCLAQSTELSRYVVWATSCALPIAFAAIALVWQTPSMTEECSKDKIACFEALVVTTAICVGVTYVMNRVSKFIQGQLEDQQKLRSLETTHKLAQQAHEAARELRQKKSAEILERQQVSTLAVQEARETEDKVNSELTELSNDVAQQCRGSIGEMAKSQFRILARHSDDRETQQDVIRSLFNLAILKAGVHQLTHMTGNDSASKRLTEHAAPMALAAPALITNQVQRQKRAHRSAREMPAQEL